MAMDDDDAARQARELADQIEMALMQRPATLEDLEQLRVAYRALDKVEVIQARERKVAREQRAFGEARDLAETKDMLWRSFQEACRYLRRSTMDEAAKSRAINRYGLQNYFRIPWA
jgi:hypothetical protein